MISHTDDSDNDNSEAEHEKVTKRKFMFPMYHGPSSVKDIVLRNVIESGEDNNLVTFVRTESICKVRSRYNAGKKKQP